MLARLNIDPEGVAAIRQRITKLTAGGPPHPMGRLSTNPLEPHDERSVVDALAGAIVNAVSLYVEHGQETFNFADAQSAQRAAAQAHLAGVKRLVHISGIGADAVSQSRYIRKREGELTLRAAFGDSIFVHPAVIVR